MELLRMIESESLRELSFRFMEELGPDRTREVVMDFVDECVEIDPVSVGDRMDEVICTVNDRMTGIGALYHGAMTYARETEFFESYLDEGIRKEFHDDLYLAGAIGRPDLVSSILSSIANALRGFEDRYSVDHPDVIIGVLDRIGGAVDSGEVAGIF